MMEEPGLLLEQAAFREVRMQFTPAEQTAITAHAASLGIGHDEYVRQAAAERALSWQREHDAFTKLAEQRGNKVQDLLRSGCLTDDDLP
ncbi:hypothetical protein [Streptomyces sp. wa1063]|uniref:hypothetical protein n=1 Tax=Streptomyces sp. wa1063 TaxID=1828212 RepID=UPI000BF129BB|nr:hypothetical protein [Streptomyces sp. wa1063]